MRDLINTGSNSVVKIASVGHMSGYPQVASMGFLHDLRQKLRVQTFLPEISRVIFSHSVLLREPQKCLNEIGMQAKYQRPLIF